MFVDCLSIISIMWKLLSATVANRQVTNRLICTLICPWTGQGKLMKVVLRGWGGYFCFPCVVPLMTHLWSDTLHEFLVLCCPLLYSYRKPTAVCLSSLSLCPSFPPLSLVSPKKDPYTSTLWLSDVVFAKVKTWGQSVDYIID